MLDDIYLDAEERMEKSIDNLRHQFAGIRTGRASTGLVENIKVDYYGAPTPLIQLANVAVPEPRLLMIQPYDKTAAGEIEKAILKSDLGLTPSSDGGIIRIPIPTLTEERRKELVKHVHKLSEDARIAVRNIRRDANHSVDSLKSDGKISEDDAHRAHENVQEDTDKFIKLIDEAMEVKEKEILED